MPVNNEFIKLQAETGLSNRDLSIALDYSEKVVQDWRKGVHAVPKDVMDKMGRCVKFKRGF